MGFEFVKEEFVKLGFNWKIDSIQIKKGHCLSVHE